MHRTYSLKLDQRDGEGWAASLYQRTPAGGWGRVASIGSYELPEADGPWIDVALSALASQLAAHQAEHDGQLP